MMTSNDLRERLRKELLQLTMEFGPTYLPTQNDFGSSENLDASELAKCYPDLNVLCHYTNATGLEGILKSGTFWATNVACFNDPDEFRFAYHELDKLVSWGTHKLDSRHLAAFRDGVLTGGYEDELLRTFIVSFSARRDDLSQFRAYANNTCGYALEFNPFGLLNALNSYPKGGSCKGITLRKVRYGTEEMETFHNRAIDALKNCMKELPHPAESEEFLMSVRTFGMEFCKYLREAGIIFKQKGYENESEYRAVLEVEGLGGLPPELRTKVAVRFRGAIPIPYIPLQFLPEIRKTEKDIERNTSAGLHSIIVGPGIDYNRAQFGLSCLLNQNGLIYVNPIQSNSSYRTS